MFDQSHEEAAATYLGMMALFQTTSKPRNSHDATPAGDVYATCYLADDLPDILNLAQAIEGRVAEALASSDQPFAQLPAHTIAALASSYKQAKCALQIGGFFARDVDGRTVWSDAPLEYAGPFAPASFVGLEWDGQNFGEVAL